MERSSTASAVLCADGSGTYGPGIERQLPLTQTYRSDWWSNGSYYARRRDSSGSITYQFTVSIGSHIFMNSVDAFRRTAITSNGSGTANWTMEQYALGVC